MKRLSLSKIRRILSFGLMISMLGMNTMVYAEGNVESSNEIYELQDESTEKIDMLGGGQTDEEEVSEESNNIENKSKELESESINESKSIEETEESTENKELESIQESEELENEIEDDIILEDDTSENNECIIEENGEIKEEEENEEDNTLGIDEDIEDNIDSLENDIEYSIDKFRNLLEQIGETDNLDDLLDLISNIHRVYNRLSDNDKVLVQKEYDYIVNYENQLKEGETDINTLLVQEELKVQVILRYENEKIGSINSFYGFGSCKYNTGHSGFNHIVDCEEIYNSVKDKIPSGWSYWKYSKNLTVDGSSSGAYYGAIRGRKGAHYNITGKPPYETDEVIIIYYKNHTIDNTKETIDKGYGNKYNWNEYIVYHSNYPSKQNNKDYTVTYNIKANYDWSYNSDNLKNYSDIEIFSIPSGYKLKNITWNTESDGGGTDYNDDQSYRLLYSNRGKTLHLYAQYVPDEKLTLQYIDRNEVYKEIKEDKTDEGFTTQAIDCTNTNGNLVFKGWDTDESADEVVYTVGDDITITDDTKLYAVWSEKGKFKYTVEWLDDNDNRIREPKEYEDDEGKWISISYSDRLQTLDRNIWKYNYQKSKHYGYLNTDNMVFKLYYTRDPAYYFIECYDKDTNEQLRFDFKEDGYNGDIITATDADKLIDGYAYDDGNIENIESITLDSNDILSIKLYFKKIIPYKVQYLDENGNNLKDDVLREGFRNNTVEIRDEDKIIENYTFDSENGDNILSAILDGDDKLLKLYFRKNQETVSYKIGKYGENDNLLEELTREADKGTKVEVLDSDKEMDGYIFDSENEHNVLVVDEVDNDTILKVYFKKEVKPATPSNPDKEDPDKEIEEKPAPPSDVNKEEPPIKDENTPPIKDETHVEEEKPSVPEQPKEDTIPKGNNKDSSEKSREPEKITINDNNTPLIGTNKLNNITPNIRDTASSQFSTVINEMVIPLNGTPDEENNITEEPKQDLDSLPKTDDITNMRVYLLVICMSLFGLGVLSNKINTKNN